MYRPHHFFAVFYFLFLLLLLLCNEMIKKYIKGHCYLIQECIAIRKKDEK